jgi:hypothetical protein
MNEGWIKLYRKALESDIFEDVTAWRIFTWLLLKVDYKTGKKKIGRIWASEETKLNPSTFYKGLLRLQNKYKIIKLSTGKVTIKYTEIEVINWEKYQSSNNQVTIREQSSNTLQEVKNKEVKNITNVIVKPKERSKDIDEVGTYFLKVMQIPKEDCTQRQSRQYWQLLLKESKTGVDGVKWLIDLANKDDFYGNNISSSKDLYYKRIKLIQRKRGDKPQIAVMK